jgi:hypothetical protein
LAIETMLTVKALYLFAGLQTTGFVASLFALQKIGQTAPDHSPLSRRAARCCSRYRLSSTLSNHAA